MEGGEGAGSTIRDEDGVGVGMKGDAVRLGGADDSILEEAKLLANDVGWSGAAVGGEGKHVDGAATACDYDDLLPSAVTRACSGAEAERARGWV